MMLSPPGGSDDCFCPNICIWCFILVPSCLYFAFVAPSLVANGIYLLPGTPRVLFLDSPGRRDPRGVLHHHGATAGDLLHGRGAAQDTPRSPGLSLHLLSLASSRAAKWSWPQVRPHASCCWACLAGTGEQLREALGYDVVAEEGVPAKLRKEGFRMCSRPAAGG